MTKPYVKQFGLPVLLFWASCTTVWSEEEVDLPEYLVLSDRWSPTVPTLERLDSQRTRTPGGVDLIDVDGMRDQRLSNLRDLLEYSPGVFVQSSGAGMKVSIRGSGVSDPPHLRGIRMLQDGIPLSGVAEGSGGDYGFVDPHSVSSTEVYRGSNGLIYGASLLGGVINFNSRTGLDSPGYRFRADGGSFGFLGGFASHGTVSENIDAYAALSYRREDGFQDHSESELMRIGANAGWRWTDAFESRLYVAAIKHDTLLPGNLTREQLREDPRQANPGFVASAGASNKKLFRAAKKASVTHPGFVGEVSMFYVYQEQDHPLFGTYLDSLVQDVGVSGRTVWESDTNAGESVVTAGVLAVYGTKEDERFENQGGSKGALTQANDSTGRLFEGFFDHSYSITENLAGVYGAQYTFLRRENRSVEPSVGETFSRDYSHLSPRVGLVWQTFPQAQFFTNVSRSYEPPNASFLVDRDTGELRDLDAQKADTLEIGSRGGWERASWDVTVYQSWLKGEFLSMSDADGAPLGVVNARDTVHRGLELGLTSYWPGGGTSMGGVDSTFRIAYTWNDFKFDDDPVFGNNRVGGVPEHVLRSEWRLDLPREWFIAPNVEWVLNDYPVDQANTVSAASYTIFGIRAGWSPVENLRLFGEVRNLADKTYVAATGTALADAGGADVAAYRPGEGRGFYFGVDWSF